MHTYKKNGYKKAVNGAMASKNGQGSIVESSLKRLPWTNMVRTTKPQGDEAPPTVESEVAKAKKARYEETGFAINVEHFYTVKQVVIGLDVDYVSPNPLFALPNLEVVYTAANLALIKVVSKLTQYQQTIDVQTVAFEGLKKASTRARAIFSICGAPKEAVERCNHINDEIQGIRIIKLKASDADDNRHSASHQSRSQQIMHVDAYIELFTMYPEYVAPADLTVAAFTARRNAMADSLKDVIAAQTTLKLERLNRNMIIQAPGTGLVDVAFGVKEVIKGIFGARSPQYRMVSGITFRRLPGYKEL